MNGSRRMDHFVLPCPKRSQTRYVPSAHAPDHTWYRRQDHWVFVVLLSFVFIFQVVYLASDRARHISGTVLTVDKGATKRA